MGGSARLAVLGDFQEELMGKRPAEASEPDYMVAKGSGVCAGIKSRLEELRDIVMTDICPFSLGIATYAVRRQDSFDEDAQGCRDRNAWRTILL